MRLLQLGPRDELKLVSLDEDNLPPYAILSHTWGDDDDEVTFDDIQHGATSFRNKPGYAKVRFCGQQALKDDLKHFWVDSCCINKPNYTELSEALNSMFRWYKGASKCYVYLQDVSARKRDSDGQVRDCTWEAALRKSRWFTRGWTLQELLAPRIVEFWSRDGQLLGTKDSLRDIIVSITEIPSLALGDVPLSQFTPNERLRWGASRITKKKEDRAYCLLGLFGVFLSPIYGEGDNAFVRLKTEIDRLFPAQPASDRLGPSIAQLDKLKDDTLRRRKNLLSSLNFEEINTRHLTIEEAQRTTCEWLLEHPDYLAWNNAATSPREQDRCVLWIAGKPGAGKSTLMKFALTRARKAKTEDEIILSFFFNARGGELEKSTLGMYRSLLLQLLSKVPELEDVLDEIDTSDTSQLQSYAWTNTTLKSTLRATAQRLRGWNIKCYIDALDECEEEQVRDMINFFDDLGHDIRENYTSSRLTTCFASRHYPTIKISGARRVVVEHQAGHTGDLTKYIRRHLRVGHGAFERDIQKQVQKKANGVFMWVVLVVRILMKEVDRGNMSRVEERLQELPSQLSDLFRDIVKRDNENLDTLLLCLQWILYAKRPLTCEEYYFAMITGLRRSTGRNLAWRPDPWDRAKVTREDMVRFVENSSKGMAEVPKLGRRTSPRVQFIHESVRDFLLKDGGLRELWPNLDRDCDFDDLSHNKLKICCTQYLTADLSIYIPQDQLPDPASDQAQQLLRQLSSGYPFLDYACQSVLYHADEAAHGVDQTQYLKSFPLARWVHVANIYEPDETTRHGTDVTLCYIAAEYNLARVLAIAMDQNVWTRLPSENYQLPLIAAFAHGSTEALTQLVKPCDVGTLDGIFADSEFGAYPNYIDGNQDLVLWAIANDCHGMALYLMEASQDWDVNARDYGGNALQFASASGDEELVEALLGKGADVNAQDARHVTALKAALVNRRWRVARLLLTNGAQPDRKGSDDAILLALESGDMDLMQLLIDKGAKVNVRCVNNSNAVRAACAYESDMIRHLAVNNSGDSAFRDAKDGNAFKGLSAYGNRDNLDLLWTLLDKYDGDLHQDDALLAASEIGDWERVELLLAKHSEHGVALAQGSRRGYLRHGQQQDTRSTILDRVLMIASLCGRTAIVQLLLDQGAGGLNEVLVEADKLRKSLGDIVPMLLARGARR